MSRSPSLSAQTLMRALERAGFQLVRVRGSHYFYRHQADPSRSTVVPFHRGGLPRGTVGAILKQAGISTDELKELLGHDLP